MAKRFNFGQACEIHDGDYIELYSYDEKIATVTYNEFYKLRTLHLNVAPWDNGKPTCFCSATTRRHLSNFINRLNQYYDIPTPYQLSYNEIKSWYNYCLTSFDEAFNFSYTTNSGIQVSFHTDGL